MLLYSSIWNFLSWTFMNGWLMQPIKLQSFAFMDYLDLFHSLIRLHLSTIILRHWWCMNIRVGRPCLRHFVHGFDRTLFLLAKKIWKYRTEFCEFCQNSLLYLPCSKPNLTFFSWETSSSNLTSLTFYPGKNAHCKGTLQTRQQLNCKLGWDPPELRARDNRAHVHMAVSYWTVLPYLRLHVTRSYPGLYWKTRYYAGWLSPGHPGIHPPSPPAQTRHKIIKNRFVES
jgi:hypothetical protein